MNIHASITSSRDLSRRGFTLVETLVAIAILMIAIAGPLVIATKGLTSALYSKDQMIASFLAQESMEVIKNVHDNNIAGSGVQNWLANLSGCTEENPCDASGINTSRIQTDCPDDGCPVYYSGSSGYNAYGDGDQTQFSRRFWIDQIRAEEQLVHVVVTWKVGSVPFEIHLVSTITATAR